MEKTYPEFIYKYRPIENYENLKSDKNLDALFNQYAIFSSRVIFNDLFDSKIDLIKPEPKEIKELLKHLRKADRRDLLSHVEKGRFTHEGTEFISKMEIMFNEQIDSYAFISLSSIPNSNLMWSHYGASHHGFCIEYRTEYVKARKVDYAKNIPSLELIDFYKIFYKLPMDEGFSQKILDALHCKLDEWSYESEYRFMAANNLAVTSEGKRFVKVKYDVDYVESVIFGYRMDEKTKKFIIANMPTGTRFKQATIGKNAMKIVEYKPIKTM